MLCPDELIKVHLTDIYSFISIQIVHLPLKCAEGAVYTIEVQVFPALNQTIILGMPFLHQLNPNIN